MKRQHAYDKGLFAEVQVLETSLLLIQSCCVVQSRDNINPCKRKQEL